MSVIKFSRDLDTIFKSITLTVESDSIELRCFCSEEGRDDWEVAYTLLLDDLRIRNNFDDGSLFIIPVSLSGHIFPIYNRTAFSFGELLSGRGNEPTQQLNMISVYVRTTEDTFEDMDFIAQIPTECEFICNKPYEETSGTVIDYANINAHFNTVNITADVTELAPDAKTTLHLSVSKDGELLSTPVEVYLSTSCGYLPYRKIKVVGTKDVPFYALGLNSGDTAKIKAGYRWFSALDKVAIKIA